MERALGCAPWGRVLLECSAQEWGCMQWSHLWPRPQAGHIETLGVAGLLPVPGASGSWSPLPPWGAVTWGTGPVQLAPRTVWI